MKFFPAVFLYCMVLALSLTADPLHIISLSKEGELIKENTTYIYKDSLGHLTLHDLLKRKVKFVEAKSGGYTTQNAFDYYWKKTTVVNTSDKTWWLLEFPDPHIGHLQLYIYKDKEIKEYPLTGFDVPFGTRPLSHKNFTFPLEIPKNDTIVLYTRMWSSRQFDFISQFRTLENFTNYFFAEYHLLGLYYGIIFLMVIYNLFLGIYSKEKFYLYYCLYTISCAFFTYVEDGIAFQWLWPSFPVINYFLDSLAPIFLLGAFVLYSSNFVELQKQYPKMYLNILIVSVIYIICRLVLTRYNQLTFLIYIIPFVLTFYAALKSYREGIRSARFFVIGNSLILISFLVYLGRLFGLVPPNAFTVYLFNLGFVFESIIFSIALADKVKIAKDQKEKAQKEIIRQLEINESLQQKVNKELEEKVRDRTKELVEANSKLEALKKELYEMNSKMDINIWELKKEVKKEMEARITNDTLSFEEFMSIYPDHKCYQYLKELKWKDGFECPKCSNKKYGRGNNNYTLKCTQCQFQESVTSHTLFHGVKFQLSKAFYLAYYFLNNGNNKPYEEIAENVGLTKNTVWKFGKKVLIAKESLGKKINGNAWEKLVLVEVEKLA